MSIASEKASRKGPDTGPVRKSMPVRDNLKANKKGPPVSHPWRTKK